jgi:hypothetical protein
MKKKTITTNNVKDKINERKMKNVSEEMIEKKK